MARRRATAQSGVSQFDRSDDEASSYFSSDMESSASSVSDGSCSEDGLSGASQDTQGASAAARTEGYGEEVSARGGVSPTPDPDTVLGKMPHKMTKAEMLAAIARAGLDLLPGETANCMKGRLNQWRRMQLLKIREEAAMVVSLSHGVHTFACNTEHSTSLTYNGFCRPPRPGVAQSRHRSESGPWRRKPRS